MTSKNSRYINVDELATQISVEQVVDYFGVAANLSRSRNEVRTNCFMACGRCKETGDRAIAIQADHPAKIWKCHAYECGKDGNLVSMVHMLVPGGNPDEKPRGDRFKEVAKVLRSIATGEAPPEAIARRKPAALQASAEQRPVQNDEPKVNVPLEESENERVRSIADLQQHLTMDLGCMSPAASRYVRTRPFLSDSLSEKRKFGYLPKQKGDKRFGGTMADRFVYAINNRDGKPLAYVGRDPDYEEKHQRWIQTNREGKEPIKYRFPSSFFRGVELYGQELFTEDRANIRRLLRDIGLPIVEGFNDHLNLLSTLKVPSVAIMSNHATDHQIKRIAELAHDVAGGVATLLLDCDEQGDKGADQMTVPLSKLCRVQRAWSMDMFDGKFAGRQPESLSLEEGRIIRDFISKSR